MRALPTVLLVACAEDVLPDDLSAEPLGACLLPVPAWTEPEAVVAVDLDELVLDATVLGAGVGTPPSPCWQEDGFALWLEGEVDPSRALWARLSAAGREWMLAVDAPGASLPSTGALTVRHRVFFPAGRDEVPRGHLVVEDASGVLLWGSRHLDPGSAQVPEGFGWADAGETSAHRSDCGEWTDRAQRVATPDGETTLDRDQSDTVGPWTLTSGGFSRIANTAAWACPDALGTFGAAQITVRPSG